MPSKARYITFGTSVAWGSVFFHQQIVGAVRAFVGMCELITSRLVRNCKMRQSYQFSGCMSVTLRFPYRQITLEKSS
eukprot:2937799-Ditylum_brightwellii.AAC.1